MENVLLGYRRCGQHTASYGKNGNPRVVLIVTAISPIHPLREIEEAKEIAAEGVTHILWKARS